jgi:hypothetical protein
MTWLRLRWRLWRHPEEFQYQRLRRQWLEDLRRHHL